ncbi:MAG: DUF4832 domain-containing protein [Clostridia bacterium]|nr:DUF4832 domain-containing protein [Clostridia bacterium]
MRKYIVALLIIFLISSGAVYMLQNLHKFSLDSQSFTESADELANPYCGWYNIYGYILSDNNSPDSKLNFEISVDPPENRLVLLEINLKEYRLGAISETGLSQLDYILSAWESADRTIILRFLYDWDGKAYETEPSDINTVMLHMTQTADIVNSHASGIYVIQGIFVGNCGEMNNSNYMSQGDMCTLASHLASVIDVSIPLSVRTPAHWREIMQSFDPAAALNGQGHRFGLFNDGMMGSQSDLGTYGDKSFSGSSVYSDKGTREEEIAFQNTLCLYAPNGGEAVIDNSFNDYENAVHTLNSMHISYLNSLYDAQVLNKWKAAVHTHNDVFNGLSGYEYISRHLGYRFVLRDCRLQSASLFNRGKNLVISIENTGFANCYKSFPLRLTITNTETGSVTYIDSDADTRTFDSGKTTDIIIPLDTSTLQPGSYSLTLECSDPALKKPILFANKTATKDGIFLGTLHISRISETFLS